ncbi:MBL fold metallo-hydrolase [Teichococcus rhizosphaerae]|uniref:MBL fold metallo-hydrolase n=1 Tax=Teichococcus rhizosphaerae TaxID=1335062 RepID=UPI001C3F357F|nr:MBL fold metallo-hydrolase [Pseudoroseomonas rhizosphaerae]
MTVFLCTACGTFYPEAAAPPASCPICEDERQYVPAAGQSWTSREALAGRHRNAWRRHEPGLFSIQTVPAFAIDQRAFLLVTPRGNILWDCIALLDEATEALVRGLGGIAAIAISHPHYYTAMQDWAAAFGATLHLHAADREWIMRPSPALHLWEGETLEVAPGATLIRAGGHFPGGTVLHWAGTADEAGALLAGDIVQVTPGARRVSFMWSYPNMMPLPAAEVRRVAARLAPWRFQRIYGAFAGQDVPRDGPEVIARSAARYVELLEKGTGLPPARDAGPGARHPSGRGHPAG